MRPTGAEIMAIRLAMSIVVTVALSFREVQTFGPRRSMSVARLGECPSNHERASFQLASYQFKERLLFELATGDWQLKTGN